MTIEERLTRLEHQNRRLKWLITGLIAAAITGCAMGLKASTNESSTAPPAVSSVIRAERFEVIDSDGNAVVVIGPNQTGGVVYINNKSHTTVAQMGTADDGRGVVWVYDRNGQLRHGIE